MDYYLNDEHCINRLFDEYQRYGSLIIAYDYDNTVFDYYNRGYEYNQVINLLRECKKMGFHLTVFTSCNDDRFPEIRQYLNDNNIPFDGINETPEFIEFKGRKVYYNHLLDDRAGLSAAFKQLDTLIYKIRGHNATKDLTEVA